ncbi:MAG: rhodanese-like domain-containing protein [Alphaproteobacteria bacterium]|nr:rhodanese-like domain-containing protein [Alphaproteobacteria bacterium]
MPQVAQISATETLDALASNPDALLIDVRTKAEWQFTGTVDLSHLGKTPALIEWTSYPDGTPNPNFTAMVEQSGATHDTPLYFLCRSGVRSQAAATMLAGMGYQHCHNIIDGYEGPPNAAKHRNTLGGWRAEGLPWQQP